MNFIKFSKKSEFIGEKGVENFWGLNNIDHIVFKVLKISRNERNKEILRKGVLKNPVF